MLEPRVAASYVQLLYEYLAGLGGDPVAVLGAMPDAHFVSMRAWQAMLARVQALDPAPALGLRLARGIGARHFGVLGYAALACGNLAQALQRLERHHQAVYDANPPRVQPVAGGLCIEWGVERGRPGALVDETAIASLVQLARDMTGHPVATLAVHFVNPAPADLSPYEAFFGGPVLFEQPNTRVLLRSADLALPMRKSDPALLALLDQQAERLLQEVAALPEAAERWRATLVSLIRSGQTSLAALARAHHMSPRSLQRRLAEQGVSFQRLLDDTRRQLADAYLRDPTLELAEIALLLGYSEQSAFTRAFRHWSGVAPAQWRKQNGGASL
ncbi:MAG: AraC family transcriptional regulator [Rubrivivax sp.]|nr:MAG: AraC family transcriptional regulator [Rubrivivax sp.]